MSTREVVDCDGCPEVNLKLGHHIRISLVVGSQLDGSGCGRDDMYENRDLCASCAQRLIDGLTNKFDYKECRDLIDKIDARKRSK